MALLVNSSARLSNLCSQQETHYKRLCHLCLFIMPKQSFQSLPISSDAELSLHWKSETGSTSPYHKLSKYFKIMNIPWVSKSWYYKIQDKNMFGVAIEAWTKERELNILQWNQRYLILSEDGCCHSAGHNPKYLNYSLFDQNSKKKKYLLHHLHN